MDTPSPTPLQIMLKQVVSIKPNCAFYLYYDISLPPLSRPMRGKYISVLREMFQYSSFVEIINLRSLSTDVRQQHI